MKRDVFKTYEAFPGDELTEAECDNYRKRARFLDPAKVTQAEINDMKQGFVSAIRKPMNMNAVELLCNKGDKTKFKFTDSVSDDLLFQQLERGRNKRQFITHNFDSHSQHYVRLFTWPIFNEMTEGIMRPIHYLIQKRAKQPISNKDMSFTHSTTVTSSSKTAKPVNNDTQKRLHLQHQIANDTVTCTSLVTSIEDTMGCLLVRLIVRENKFAFIFEWYEESLFMFFMAFDTPECEVPDMTLHRSDLFMAIEVEEESVEEVEDNLLGGQRKYREDDVLMHVTKKPEITFISFYGQKIALTELDIIKNCEMTYITYGYIKKENAPY